MTVPENDWSNKGGTGTRNCSCGSWKQHWLNFSRKIWPNNCSRYGCSNLPSLGGHVINQRYAGEQIVPLCESCNQYSGKFDLKYGVTLVSANRTETCG